LEIGEKIKKKKKRISLRKGLGSWREAWPRRS